MGLDAWTSALLAYGPLGVGLGMFFESAAVPLPSELILPFAGYLVAAGRLSWTAAASLALAGALGGGLVLYWIGRYGGRPLLARWGRRLRLGRHELAVADQWFRRHGDQAVFWGRLLPGVRTYISLPAGLAAMPVWRFLAYSLLGSLPWTVALIAIGAALGSHWQQALALAQRLDGVLVLALVAAVAVWLLRRKRAMIR